MIETLVEKGFAYAAENGDVYYRVRKFADYGKLNNRQLDDMRSGARVEVDVHKEDPLDFVLWKAAKPGEAHWHSPGETAAQAGISNVRPCPPAAWGIPSIFMAVGRI